MYVRFIIQWVRVFWYLAFPNVVLVEIVHLLAGSSTVLIDVAKQRVEYCLLVRLQRHDLCWEGSRGNVTGASVYGYASECV